MAIYGYARVSTEDQDLSIQCEALERAGCTMIRREKVSGTSRDGRRELELLLSFLQRGDTLTVTRIDRLARSVLDLQVIVNDLKLRGVTLHDEVSYCAAFVTRSAADKAFLDMLGVFAEFETSLRRERQIEGIKKAKAAGIYKGAKKRLPRADIISLTQAGKGPAAIARELKVGRASVYRVLKEAA